MLAFSLVAPAVRQADCIVVTGCDGCGPLYCPHGETGVYAGMVALATELAPTRWEVLDEHAAPWHGETVRNITVSLDDETYRRARMKAAEQDTSVSALVRRFLADLAAGESENERLRRQERVLREQITAFRAGDRLSRDAVHRRGR
jgi:hypothetical protein